MKQNIKRIWLALCMAVCLFALSACSSAEADTAEEMDPSLVMTLQQGTQQYLDLFAAMGDEDLDNALAASEKNKDTVMQSALNSWKSVRGDLGALVSSEAAEVGIVDDGYVARIPAVFEKRNAEFSVIVDEDLANITSITISPEYTTGEKLSKAGMNTLMGMGVVFLVLIFISWLISMFKYISVFEAKMKQKSFTGALTDKTGAFVAANGGTIFLDEIGNLSYEVQIQLLRALQERKIRPVGSTQEVSVDIRLVSATNENLEQAIEKGTFREDLFHRINEFTLRMPDLKERKEDILLFANFFLDQANKELDKHLIGFDSKASQALLNYHWPGNLRQMKNIVKRATLLAQGSFITLLELGTELLETSTVCSASMALRNEETEKEHILEALRQTGNNKSKAAQLLNIDRKTLYNKLKLYNIDL